jgi:hypothetical protein
MTSTIITTPLETMNNDNIQDASQKLSTSLTLTVYSKKNDQLKFLVNLITSNYLSDICYIDDLTRPISILKLLENVSEEETQQITFVRLNKLV